MFMLSGVLVFHNLVVAASFRWKSPTACNPVGVMGRLRRMSSVIAARTNDAPLPKDSIVQVSILELTSQGDGLARFKVAGDAHADSAGWTIMIPNALPDENITCRIVENHRSYRYHEVVCISVFHD